MLERTSHLERDKSQEDVYVKDEYFGEYPYFESRQVVYRKVGRTLTTLIENTEHMGFHPEEVEIIERIFVDMSVIDHMIDNMRIEKSRVTDMVVHENSPATSLNNSLAHLRELIEKHGDYEAYIGAATRAISYSGKDSIQDRHREALYLGKAIAMAVCKDDIEKRDRLANVLGVLTSLGNFLDDVMDYKNDGKNLTWATGRAGAALREVQKLYKTSDRANTYLFNAALTGLTLYGRRLIPQSLKKPTTFDSPIRQ